MTDSKRCDLQELMRHQQAPIARDVDVSDITILPGKFTHWNPEGNDHAKAMHRFDNSKRRRPDQHGRHRWLTPSYVLEPIRKLLHGIELDPCTESDNPTRAAQYYCLPQDGCSLPWDAANVFCNPPYGQARERWVKRCIKEGQCRKVVLLIPSHTETRISQMAMQSATSILFLRARLRFEIPRANGRKEAASHGTAIYGFGVDLTPLSLLGVILVHPTTIRDIRSRKYWKHI